MKKITFTKLLAPTRSREYQAREDYPGYLMKPTWMPGIEIVLARGSTTTNHGSGWRFTSYWYAYDRDTGQTLGKKLEATSRAGCFENVVAQLAGWSAEQYREYVIDRMAVRMAKLIGGT